MGSSAARIIAFSGVDGAGKSTQIELLRQHLAERSMPVVHCWARGGYTPLFSILKRLLRKSAGGKLPAAGQSSQRDRTMGKRWIRRVWLLASILDLGLLYGVQVRWWRLRGKTVICDRYVADTRIDFKLNFPEDGVPRWWLWRALERFVPRPDAVFLMLLPVEESLRRCRAKNEPFPDSAERLGQRLQEYRVLSGVKGYVALDARDPIPDLFATIRAIYDGLGSSGDSPP